MQDIFFPAVAVILWTVAVVITTRKYLSARKKNLKADAWIWLFVWCALVAFIEWPVFFVYSLLLR